LPVAKSPVPAGAAPGQIMPPASAAAPVQLSEMPASSFSFSMLEEYIDCPERYRLRYVVGLPTPVHHSPTYGRAFHAAVAWYPLRVAAGEAPAEQALFDEFRANWRSEGFLSR